MLTAYWPGDSWSPFIAMHIEQPASRHSAPADLKILARPSDSASRFTSSLAGHDHQPDAVGDMATLEHGRREPEIADPTVRARADEDDVDLLAEDRLARAQVHVLERVLERSPLGGSAWSAGEGTRLVIGMPIPGFVPYVTIGSSASASMVIVRSNVAPSSVGSGAIG